MSGGKHGNFFFSPAEHPIERHEEAQADQEEYDPALVMQPSEQEIGIHIFRQDGQGGDAYAVLDRHHDEPGEDKHRLLPEPGKGEMGDEYGEN